MRLLFAVLTLFVLIAGGARAAEPAYPALTGRVVDEAGVLSAATRSGLTEMLAQHERQTREQVVVVTLKSLQGLPIEDFGYQLGRHWGIGEKDKNTGALLIVAPAEHKVRIEAGYGLEGKLTDALSRTIIERDIVPAFKRGDLDGGVLAGTASLLRVLGGNPGAAAAPTTGWKRDRFNPADVGSWVPLVIFFGLWFSIAGFIMRRVRQYDPVRHRYIYLWPALGAGLGAAGGFSGGGFGGGGGGGFSGGGGSFGGGGASGSW